MISTLTVNGPPVAKVDRIRALGCNTFERSPARPVVARVFRIDSPWFNGHAAVATFELAELIATKIRALFQRKKGRDLFDLWLAVRHAGLGVERSPPASSRTGPTAGPPRVLWPNLHAKLDDAQFAHCIARRK